jgi:DNA-binding transcriptional regulator PaaX
LQRERSLFLVEVCVVDRRAVVLRERLHRAAAQFDRETFGRRRVYGLVDFWHTLEKLAAAAKVVEPKEAEKLRARWKLRLLNASSARAEIFRELRASEAEHFIAGDAETSRS